MTSTKLTAGNCVGRFRLCGSAPIGRGGNSVVWKAVAENGEEVAIKFLFEHLILTKRYRRFVTEATFSRSLAGIVGVVPVIDFHLPESPTHSDRPWIAMKLAKPLIEEVADAELERIVRDISNVAATLTELHDNGVAHRDIKPDNLFYYNERAAIGDFGLVAYPGKESITDTHERMGPLFYLAPEMISESDDAKAYPGDVYSLAKSLWVLATRQRYPLQGELRSDVKQLRLSTYVLHDRTYVLDTLLDRATRTDPSERPTMAVLASELDMWCRPPSREQSPNLSSLQDRVRAAIASSERAKDVAERRLRTRQNLIQRLEAALQDMALDIESAIGLKVQVYGNTNAILPYSGMKGENGSLEIRMQSRDLDHVIYFRSGFVLSSQREGNPKVWGTHVVHVMNESQGRQVGITKIGETLMAFQVETLDAARTSAEWLSNLRTSLPSALEIFVGAIENPTHPLLSR